MLPYQDHDWHYMAPLQQQPHPSLHMATKKKAYVVSDHKRVSSVLFVADDHPYLGDDDGWDSIELGEQVAPLVAVAHR